MIWKWSIGTHRIVDLINIKKSLIENGKINLNFVIIIPIHCTYMMKRLAASRLTFSYIDLIHEQSAFIMAKWYNWSMLNVNNILKKFAFIVV